MLSLSLAIYGYLEKGCWKNDEHATIPKGKTGYDQYKVPDTIASCRTYFCCFHLVLANVHPWPLVPFFQISLKNSELKTIHNHTFRDVAYTLSENVSRNSCIRVNVRLMA